MPRIVIAAEDSTAVRELAAALACDDFACAIASSPEKVTERTAEETPDLIVFQADSPDIASLCCQLRRERGLPTIALASLEAAEANGHIDADDFVISPCDPREVLLRAKRLLRSSPRESPDLIRRGDLTINTARCEVAVAGQAKMLTFKEYQLLKFLASNPGQVFSRETLLDRVWGHDYFGGDRTVDVHIRRLRSKLEDSGHTFIETVRNIGYAFTRTP